MRTTAVFWGVFFVFLGILFLIWNLEGWTFDLDYMIIYWPVLLILWGLSYLKLPHPVRLLFAGIAGLFASLIIMTLIVWAFEYFNISGKPVKPKQINMLMYEGKDMAEILKR